MWKTIEINSVQIVRITTCEENFAQRTVDMRLSYLLEVVTKTIIVNHYCQQQEVNTRSHTAKIKGQNKIIQPPVIAPSLPSSATSAALLPWLAFHRR